jgi:hypothetical protein
VPSFRDLQSEFMPVRDVYAQQARSLSRLEQLAVWITDRIGSMGFFEAARGCAALLSLSTESTPRGPLARDSAADRGVAAPRAPMH